MKQLTETLKVNRADHEKFNFNNPFWFFIIQ
ncbi:hypothetical protein CLW00_105168 [Mongoliibacter ruber]|uniref:Uncharacterized protein n=1 Tax=Mongoliibacter ruber TaxID=1750599 RepID=A0A2T0WMX1_9BACT|nr:hypothetical protein CLW00_105168 [Mongoliibacter ruber]